MSGLSIRRRLTGNMSTTLLAGYTLLFVVFLLAPIVIVVLTSFTPHNIVAVPTDGLSLRWYERTLTYRPFMASLRTSLILAFLATAMAVVLAVPAALALARQTGRLAGGISAFLLSPIAVPPLVIGLSSLYFLSSIGIGTSFLALLIVHTVTSVPYILRTVLASYIGLSPSLSEAASILGAGRWQVFRFVTLPLIMPGIFAGALFSFLISLDNVGLSFFFGSAQATTLPVVMLSYLENQFDPSIAAISCVQMLIAVVLLFLIEKVYGLRPLIAQ